MWWVHAATTSVLSGPQSARTLSTNVSRAFLVMVDLLWLEAGRYPCVSRSGTRTVCIQLVHGAPCLAAPVLGHGDDHPRLESSCRPGRVARGKERQEDS